jgi:triosephosphate isomerase
MKYIVGNWKMNLSHKQAITLAKTLVSNVKNKADVVPIICPSAISLQAVAEIIKGSFLQLGAQDCFWEESGAFTGMTSPQFLVDLGCRYVIIGHSERRQYLAESDDMINKKIAKARQVGLTPIVCVGETFEQRRNNVKDAVVSQQVISALTGVSAFIKLPIIIAYEPVWVIGSGQAVTAEEADHTAAIIRNAVREVLPDEFCQEYVHTIYGGSVSANNFANFLAQKNINGGLIGSASLIADDYCSLVNLA